MIREREEDRKEKGWVSLVRILIAGLVILSVSLVEAKENINPVTKTTSNRAILCNGVNPVRNIKTPRKENEISNGVKIAILDSGCNIAYKEGISLIDRTVRDYNGHGTLTAKIIKEKAPLSELYIIKVMDEDGLCPNEEAVIRGIEWAASRGVNVINMSLRLKDSERLKKAIRMAYDKGVIIVAAAGNASSRVNNQYGFNLEEVAYPAKYDEVIAVGAIDRYGRVYDGSIKGKEVELVCRGYKGRYAGTSIASAYATGIVARTISKNPLLCSEELRWLIRQEAEKSGGELK